MFNLLLTILFWFFALYGFIEIIIFLIYNYLKLPKKINENIHITLKVRNAEDYIEPFLRILFIKIFYYDPIHKTNVTIINMNSSDNTEKILKKLQQKYSFILKTNSDDKDTSSH